MANTAHSNGTVVSFSNTPQAVDDNFTSLQAGSTEGSSSVVYLDVMANDKGGNGKSMWALDNGVNNSGAMNGNIAGDLLTQDLASAAEIAGDTSLNGARIWITADGKIGYDTATLSAAFAGSLQALAAGEALTDSLTYAIRLGNNGALSWATATLHFVGTNNAPVITNASSALLGSVQEDVTLVAAGQLSARDADHGATQAWGVQGSAAGAYGAIAVDAATGRWTYTLSNGNAAVQALAGGESHLESFTVIVTDDKGVAVPQVVMVTVNGTNDAPVVTNAAAALAGAVIEATTPTVTGQLGASDVDFGATQTWSVQGSAAGAYGAIAVDASGKWTYSLDSVAQQALAAGELHAETFTVRVTDDQGAFVDQTVTMSIEGTNGAPVVTNAASALAGAVIEDTTLIASGQLGARDVDHGATQIWGVQGIAVGAYGSIAVDAAGKWIYSLDNAAHQSLAAGESHEESFTLRVTDDHGAWVDQTVTVSVAGTNDAPVITNAASALSGAITDYTMLSATGQLSASDIDHGATQTWSVQGNAMGAYGALAVDATGRWTYLLEHAGPAAGESPLESFTVRVTDDQGAFVDQSVIVRISGTNHAPVVTNDESALCGAVTEDTVLTASGQLGASDADYGATLTWSVQGSASAIYGAFSVDASGKWTYSLDNEAHQALAVGLNDAEFFTVRVTDDRGAFVDQTVLVSIAGTNDAPVITNAASALAGAVTEDTAPTASGQLGASDIDRWATQTWRVQGSASGVYGAIALDGTGKWTYTLSSIASQALAAGESHLESFRVRVTDNWGAFADQMVNITVGGTNDAPVVTNGSAARRGAVTEDTLLTATGQLGASDIDHGASRTWSVQGSALGTYGAITVDATGKWTYVLANAAQQSLAAGQLYSDAFTLRATDDHGLFVDQAVTVSIAGTNDAPVVTNAASARAGIVTEDTMLTATGQLSASDADVGATQAWSVQSDPSVYGAIVVDASGKWTYSMNNDFNQRLAAGETRLQSFLLRVRDDHGAPADQTVSITITGTNDAPVVSGGKVAGGVTERWLDSAPLNDSGFIIFTDADLTDTHTVGAVTPLPGALGTLKASIGHDTTDGAEGWVNWTYDVPNAGLEYLSAGQARVDTFKVDLMDGHGGIVPATVSVTLSGSNDVPVTTMEDLSVSLVAPKLAATPVGVAANLTDSGIIRFTDADLADVHLVSPVGTPLGAAWGTLSAVVNADTTGSGTGGQLTWNYSLPQAAISYVGTERFLLSLADQNGFAIYRTVEVSIYSTDTALYGTAGNDTLAGTAGQDMLIGGGGNDNMNGGANRDFFVYQSINDRGTTGDVITGFQAGAGGDVLQLHAMLQTFTGYDGTNAFTGGYLQFVMAGADTLVQVDSTGGADQYLTLATLVGQVLGTGNTFNYVV